jgi:hypothetical protein
MTAVQASKGSFLTTLFLFSLAIVMLGVYDLHKRSLREPAPPPGSGRALVKNLYGSVDLQERVIERRAEINEKAEDRDRDWGAVKRFLRNLVP